MKHRKYQKEMYLIIFIIHFYFQLGNSRIDSLENQFQTQKSLTSQQINNENTPDKNDLYINTISPDDQEIKNITLKNQVKKIQSAYRNYKTRNKSNPDLITDINNNIVRNTLSHKSNKKENEENKIINEPDPNYIGALDSRGNREGFGIQSLPSGDRIRGVFTNDKLTVWGIFEHRGGDVFKGEYKDNITNGYGEYSKENGAIYYGYWNNDMQIGIGYELWNDSSSYKGEYNEGKKSGIGSYLWQDGTNYMGEWNNNNIEGFGIYKYIDGRQYIGEWKNNQMHGYGEFIWVEGKKYIGFYKNDKKEGFGIYYWPNDRFFVGFWKEGKQNGVGKFIKDDVFKYGVWKNGKREKWFKDEEEFMEELKKKNKKYSFLFKSDINKLKKYMDLDDNSEEESEYESNKDFKNVEDLNNKNEQSEEEEEV